MALHLKSTGIDFADFSGSPTSELLNDYEQGVWTVTSAGTGTIGGAGATNKYSKVGDVVTATIDYILASGGTLTYLSGLPFTNGDDRQGGSCGYNTVTNHTMNIYIPASTTFIYFYHGYTHGVIGSGELVQGCLMVYYTF
jgi:hypothetical protein